MKLQFSSKALKTFELLKKQSPELSEKIKTIVKDILLHPTDIYDVNHIFISVYIK